MAYMDAAWWRREYEDMLALRDKAERERDEARAAACHLIHFCRGREDLLPGSVLHIMEQNDWLTEDHPFPVTLEKYRDRARWDSESPP